MSRAGDIVGGYKNIWKLRNGELVGVFEPKSYGSAENKYFIVQDD